jgi:hypothetical protein
MGIFLVWWTCLDFTDVFMTKAACHHGPCAMTFPTNPGSISEVLWILCHMGSSTPAHSLVSFGFCLVVLHYPNFWELHLGPGGGYACILVSAFLHLTVCPFSSHFADPWCLELSARFQRHVQFCFAIWSRSWSHSIKVHLFYLLNCILDQWAKFKCVTGLLSSVVGTCSLLLSQFILCQSVLFTWVLH